MKCTFYLTDKQLEALKLLGLTPEENEKTRKIGEKYYFITPLGRIENNIWANDEIDGLYEKFGNFFDNREDAEFTLEQLNVIRELKKYTTKPVWALNNTWYFFGYNNNIHKIIIEPCITEQILPKSMYFASQEMAQKAFDEIGEERLKKYWFEIEE